MSELLRKDGELAIGLITKVTLLSIQSSSGFIDLALPLCSWLAPSACVYICLVAVLIVHGLICIECRAGWPHAAGASSCRATHLQ